MNITLFPSLKPSRVDRNSLSRARSAGLNVSRLALAVLILSAVFGATAHAQDGTMPLSPRQAMVKGRKYLSASRGHYLIFQPDGNLVVFTAAAKKVWGLDQVKPNVKAQTIQMGADGNFVVSGPNNQFIWSALSKDPDPRAWVDLTPAGALQVVSDRGGVLWSSDGKLTPVRSAGCTPYDRWTQCVAIPNPKIKIMATKAVSQSAITLVKQIYTDMTAFLKPQYPKNKFDGFIVYITNGEPWAQLNGMGPIGPDLGAGNSGDELRGGAARDYLWLSEQMICKTGVKTRGKKDTSARTFDQVIHEFAHSIESNFGLSDRVKKVHARSSAPAEDFAWDIQHWFSAPAGNMTDAERAFVGEIFAKQKVYSCTAYKP